MANHLPGQKKTQNIHVIDLVIFLLFSLESIVLRVIFNKFYIPVFRVGCFIYFM